MGPLATNNEGDEDEGDEDDDDDKEAIIDATEGKRFSSILDNSTPAIVFIAMDGAVPSETDRV